MPPIGLYYRTIKHLKPIQIWYRLWCVLRNKLRNLTGHSYPLFISKKSYDLEFAAIIPKYTTLNLEPATRFTFLNQTHSFSDKIDWNLDGHGKLWAYNLNYFDYLNQEYIKKEEGLKLIREFVEQIDENEEGLEPYPISLRGINWIKFLSRFGLKDENIDASLYAQYQILVHNLEYHLLGNHLLENGYSLLFGAYYYRDEEFLQKSKKILCNQLEEQVLDDGSHFERSPMYHQILLERLLDCINLVKHNDSWCSEEKLQQLMENKAAIMLGWLQQMTFKSGDIPHLNDSTEDVAPDTDMLMNYAERLEVKMKQKLLSGSGYRKYRDRKYEIIADIGNIGPDYLPGHAHSDIFSFVLKINGNNIICDTGTSTYQNNERRKKERSTEAHNTVILDDVEQNETWSAFRVGRRGYVNILEEKNNEIKAQHNGYSFIGIIHERNFEFNSNIITIRDSLRGSKSNQLGVFNIHFYPDVQINKVGHEIVGDFFRISFHGHSNLQLATYERAMGYNKLKKANKAAVSFNQELTTKIYVQER